MAEDEQGAVEMHMAAARDRENRKGVARFPRKPFQARGIWKDGGIEIQENLNNEALRGPRQIGFEVAVHGAAAY